MTDSIDSPLRTAGLDQRFTLEAEMAGGEGWSARVRPSDGNGGPLHLKICASDLRELSVIAALRHPRIPRLLEYGEIPGSDGQGYVLREFVEGRPLRTGRRPSAEVERIAVEIAETLAFVHELGFAHGDLKPRNLIERGAEIHLIDFGMSGRASTTDSDDGGTGGTPGFAAPERDAGATPRGDLYSLGVVLLTCLFDPSDIDREILREDFSSHLLDRLDHADRDWSPRLRSVLRSLLEPDPERRAVDAREVLDRLVGGTGRPSVGRLQLDPFVLWPSARARLSEDPDEVTAIRGADAASRRTLLLDRSRRLGRHGRLVEDDTRTTFVPAGSSEEASATEIDLGPVSAPALAEELQRLFGLDTDAATAAADWILVESGVDRVDIETEFEDLVRRGRIVPSGAGFSWPDAQSGRLGRDADPGTEIPATPGELRALVRSGLVETAEAIYRAKSRANVRDVDRWRHAFADGLLELGESARALPLTFDRPISRARALLGLARLDDAAEVLDSLSDDTPGLALRADLASRQGRHEDALRLVRSADATAENRVLEASLTLRAGDAKSALPLLESLTTDPEVLAAPNLEAVVLANLGEARRRLGDRASAVVEFAKARAMRRDQGHLRQMAVLDLNLGVLHKEDSDFDEALVCQRRALDAFRFLQDRETAAISLLNLAVLQRQRGDLGSARGYFDEARAELEAIGHRALDSFLAVLGARLAWQQGEIGDALGLLARTGRPAFDPRTETEFSEWLAEAEQFLSAATSSSSGPDANVLRTICAINRRLATGIEPRASLRAILDASLTATGARSAYVVVERDGTIQTEMRSDGTLPRDRAFSLSLANRAIHEGRTLSESDVLGDQTLADMPSVRNLDRRSALCAPFATGSGLRGAIYVEHVGRSNVFDRDSATVLEALADQAAIALGMRSGTGRPEAGDDDSDGTAATSGAKPSRRRRHATEILGKSPPMERLRKEIQKLGHSGMSVLVHGETGTGKELVARALHREGPGADTPFVGENCSAIPAELIESELFGSVKGAFTGADVDRAGLFEQANGGTLFLDEIGDMPLPMQVKLLRALQEGVVRRVGGREPIAVSFQVITATHKDLQAMVERGEFRQDLYFRLAAGVLQVPALRERGNDVLLLADDWIEKMNKEHGRSCRRSPEMTARLLAYDWPGNVRELQHVLSRAYLLADGDELAVDQVPTSSGEALALESDWPVLTIEEATRRTIRAALKRTNGDKTKAAKLLGMSRTALYDRLKREPELADED